MQRERTGITSMGSSRLATIFHVFVRSAVKIYCQLKRPADPSGDYRSLCVSLPSFVRCSALETLDEADVETIPYVKFVPYYSARV